MHGHRTLNCNARTACLAAAVLLLSLPLVANAAGDHPALALLDRGALAVRTDPEASRRDAEAALKLLQKQPDADLEVRARLLLCDYQSERDQAAAQEQIAAANALLPNLQRAGLRAGILTCQGEVLETAGDNQHARTLYDQAVTVATQAQDDEMLANALFSRGFLLGLQGEYASGLEDLRNSQALFEKIEMPQHALTALNGIATLYNRMGDYVQARDIYTRALEAQRQAGLLREQAVTQHNLGRAHEKLREWELARQAFAGTLKISRELNYPRGEAYALRGLGAVSNGLGDPQGALATLDKAAALQGETPDVRLGAQIQLARGIALHKLQRLPESAAALEEAIAVFAEGNILHELAEAYAELAAVKAELGDWKGAYAYQSQAKATSETLLRNQLDQHFATLKVEFDTAAKVKENELLLRENASNEEALAQARTLRQMQAAVIALTVLLAIVLATLAVHQRRSTLRMRTLAMTDELTGVPNRRAVLGRLSALLKGPDPTPCAILIIDIDHFKSINDQHGHSMGDEALKVVADKVRSAVREPAFFGRLGGEEFLIVLPDTRLEVANQAAERFREQIMAVDTGCWFSDRRRITASIGVTSSLGAVDTPSSMLKRADAALYLAKRSGRNCVRTEPQITADESAWFEDAQPG